jgi:hypothetical protein
MPAAVRPRLTLAAAALVAVVPGALAAAGATVSPAAIGGARVGLSHAAYTRIFGPPATVEFLENAYSRLVFTRRQVEVYFHGKIDAGVVVGTWNRSDRTAEGIGPCSAVKTLQDAYGARLARALVGGSFAGYRLGALVFAVDAGRIRAISLKTSSAPLFVAIATAPRTVGCP